MMMKRYVSMPVLVAVMGLGWAGCGSTSTGPAGGQSRVSIAFRGAPDGISAARAAAGPGISALQVGQALALTGSNGTLTLDEVWLVVDEFELKRANDDDCLGSGSDDSCEKFEAPPQFIQLPLDGSEAPAVSQDVPPDIYKELEFEVDDLNFDAEDDNQHSDEIQALFLLIRAQFPDWPGDASMMVTGSFTPNGGSPVPFSTFFEAEIEIEVEFDPPLDLSAGEVATATVVVDPTLWFMRSDGTVMDLSQLQGQLVEFEAELEHGFTKIEFEDEDNDD